MENSTRISSIERKLGVTTIGDWSAIHPARILAIDGVGLVTLNDIRRNLAGRGVCLKNDLTPEYWSRHLCGSDGSATAAPFIIAIDKKERRPWQFARIQFDAGGERRSLLVPTQTKSLTTGDYSIVGLEDRIAIERKSLSDLFGTLGSGRARFVRELQRMEEFEVAMIVVEADLFTTAPPLWSRVSTAAVRGAIIAWSQQFPRIHWWTLRDRIAAERWAFGQLGRYFRNHAASLKTGGGLPRIAIGG